MMGTTLNFESGRESCNPENYVMVISPKFKRRMIIFVWRKFQKTTTFGARISKNHHVAIFFSKNHHSSVVRPPARLHRCAPTSAVPPGGASALGGSHGGAGPTGGEDGARSSAHPRTRLYHAPSRRPARAFGRRRWRRGARPWMCSTGIERERED